MAAWDACIRIRLQSMRTHWVESISWSEDHFVKRLFNHGWSIIDRQLHTLLDALWNILSLVNFLLRNEINVCLFTQLLALQVSIEVSWDGWELCQLNFLVYLIRYVCINGLVAGRADAICVNDWSLWCELLSLVNLRWVFQLSYQTAFLHRVADNSGHSATDVFYDIILCLHHVVLGQEVDQVRQNSAWISTEYFKKKLKAVHSILFDFCIFRNWCRNCFVFLIFFWLSAKPDMSSKSRVKCPILLPIGHFFIADKFELFEESVLR